MKKITLFIGMFCVFGSAQAGLFEYHLWVKTQANNAQGGNDVVETIEQYQTPKAYNSYNTNYYTDSYYSTNSYQNSRYNEPYTQSYYDTISHNNGYYDYNDLKRSYEKELKNLEREADYIDDIKRDIKLNLSDLRKYNSQYYYDIKASLNSELHDLEYRERQVEDEIDELEDEIKDLKKNQGSWNNRYYNYYNDGNYFDSWSDSRYTNRYNNYYSDRGYYRYDRNAREYIPHWVNPDLEEIGDGHIYIR